MNLSAGGSTPRRIGLAHLALLLPWVTVMIGSFRSVSDNSFLWHVRAGAVQARLGSVVTSDPFSFTMAGEPWLTQSWLAELGYSVLYESFGLSFIAFVMAALALVTVVAVALSALDRSGSVMVTAGVVLLTTLLLQPVLVARPVIFSFPLLALVILAWDRPNLRWTIPFLFWLWASLHSSFLIGGAYIVLRLIAKREWRAWPQIAAAGIATLMTAHGLGTVRIVLEFGSARPFLRLMQEWQTPNFLTVALIGFVIGLGWLLYSASKGRLETRDLWVVVPFLLLGLSASRAVFPAWIALATVVAGASGRLRWGKGFTRPVAVATALVIIVLPLLFIGPVDVDEDTFPVAASAHLEDVRTFHDAPSGGYFIFTDQFTDGVFIDDRAELFRERMEEMVAVRMGTEPWATVFTRDGIKQALVPPDSPLRELLVASGWREYYRDVNFAVLRP